MKEIPLTQGKVALVDDKDYPYLSKYKWHYGQYGNTGYAKRIIWDKKTKSSKIVRMHHFILPLSSGKMIDHKNGNGIDNRRNNLRLVTKSQNMMNRGIQKNSKYGFKGVSLLRGKWRAYITKDNKQIHLGLFSSTEDAAKAYNRAAKELHGEYAVLNKI